MNVSHHLDDATLISFASGTLPRSLAIVANAHIEVCQECRASLMLGRSLGGALLAAEEPVEMSSSAKDAVLGRIGSATVHRLPLARKPKQGDLPLTLQKLLKIESFDEIAWKTSAPGIQMFKLPKASDEAGFFGLLKIAPGAKVPEHSHGGSELTLILKGSYQDELGHFGPGDIADHDESIEHTPTVVGDEPCICLVANHAATRFRSWPARIMQKFVGI